MSSSLAVTFRHIFTRSVLVSTSASSQCMNVAAVGEDGGIALVFGLDVAAFVVSLCTSRSIRARSPTGVLEPAAEYEERYIGPLCAI